LAGENYRKFLIPHLRNYEVPMLGLGIGGSFGGCQRGLDMSRCSDVHRLFNGMKRFRFPFSSGEIPENGIYVLFERGEVGHSGDRIVRVGTHTGVGQLRSRLFSIFFWKIKTGVFSGRTLGALF
jgi:hypothetical protein